VPIEEEEEEETSALCEMLHHKRARVPCWEEAPK